MSNFDTFRRKNEQAKVANANVSCRFIQDGMNSTKINYKGNDIQAAVVYNNKKDGNPDEVYIYTTLDQPLQLGSIVSTHSRHILIIKEDYFVYETQFHRYYCLNCAVNLGETWGYFKGPATSYISKSLKEDVLYLSNAKPMIITTQGFLAVKDIVVVNQRPWKIIESDECSFPGIGFYSLEASVMPSTTAAVVTAPTSLSVVEAGEELEMTSQNGYIKSNVKLNNLVRSNNKVKFTVPYDVQKFTVYIKVNGAVQALEFEVE